MSAVEGVNLDGVWPDRVVGQQDAAVLLVLVRPKGDLVLLLNRHQTGEVAYDVPGRRIPRDRKQVDLDSLSPVIGSFSMLLCSDESELILSGPPPLGTANVSAPRYHPGWADRPTHPVLARRRINPDQNPTCALRPELIASLTLAPVAFEDLTGLAAYPCSSSSL
jgi:hypothetical protein